MILDPDVDEEGATAVTNAGWSTVARRCSRGHGLFQSVDRDGARCCGGCSFTVSPGTEHFVCVLPFCGEGFCALCASLPAAAAASAAAVAAAPEPAAVPAAASAPCGASGIGTAHRRPLAGAAGRFSLRHATCTVTYRSEHRCRQRGCRGEPRGGDEVRGSGACRGSDGERRGQCRDDAAGGTRLLGLGAGRSDTLGVLVGGAAPARRRRPEVGGRRQAGVEAAASGDLRSTPQLYLAFRPGLDAWPLLA